MFGLSTVKLVGGLVAALMLLSLIADRSRWMHRAHNDEAQLAMDCAATRAASNLPKLDCKQVPQQIQFIGEAIGTLTTAIHKQNDAVAAMGAETARQQAQASEAVLKAQGRAQGAQATATALIASSRSSEAQTKPCEPSKALKGAWQ